MKTIQEIAEELSKKKIDTNNEKSVALDKQGFFNGTADLLKDIADYITEELKHDNKIEVINHPKEQNVKVTNFRGIFGLLESISKSIKSFRLPNIFNVKGTVSVDNFPKIEIPEVEIPEYPTEIDANVDFKEVLTKLNELKETLSKIELSPTINIDQKTPEVQIDLESVKNGLETVVEAVKSIPTPEKVEIDLSEIEKASNETTQAIKDIRFPVSNFQSSWEHSPEMKSNDCANTIVYKTVNSQKVVDYMEFDYNGTSYRKTYSYDIDGDCTGWTGWVKQ